MTVNAKIVNAKNVIVNLAKRMSALVQNVIARHVSVVKG